VKNQSYIFTYIFFFMPKKNLKKISSKRSKAARLWRGWAGVSLSLRLPSCRFAARLWRAS